jgi:DNA integrity scanning protein DisA with diadenylate cyclase activity
MFVQFFCHQIFVAYFFLCISLEYLSCAFRLLKIQIVSYFYKILYKNFVKIKNIARCGFYVLIYVVQMFLPSVLGHEILSQTMINCITFFFIKWPINHKFILNVNK